jgi:hypothetical protein
MKVFIVLLIVGLIAALVVLLPERDGRPSEADVEQATLAHIRGVMLPISPNLPLLYEWVEKAEVIEYGKPYTVQTSEGKRTVWPVKVRLIDGQHRELKQVDLYRDELRQWEVLLIQDAS